GTHGRPWLSPAGTDLYLSLLLDPARYAASLPQLTLAAGLALSRTCGPLVDTQANLQLKWPNDLYLAGRKCAGVLIEARQEAEGLQPLVLGIGLNVNRQHFPAPLADSATSLRKHLRQPAPPWYCRHSEHGWQLKRATVLAQLLRQLEIALHCLTTPTGSAQVVQAVQQRLRWRGERVRCGGAEGRLVGLAPDGALMLDSGAGGLLTCYSGHVTLCGDSEENGS
ncbi:MAG: biotin--[acetyl-CoA-carboxylase] ligase, partial [Polyangiales bacterium]